MRHCEIAGTGTWLPAATVTFGTHTRYRIAPDESHLDALATAARRALAAAGITAEDVDCLIGASAAGVQPIPCTAALVLEQLTTGGHAAAFDVNSTCTSFITALDVASRYLEAGDYETVLIVSGDVGTRFLNPDQPESFSLFSDAAAAVVLRRTDRHAGVLASAQRTWPEHAHDTELRGGLSAHPASTYATGDPADYLFDMDGRATLLGMMRKLPDFFDGFFARSGLNVTDCDLVVPHQASPAMAPTMLRLGFAEGQFIDEVETYGNMVSASVPFAFIRALDQGRVGPGDTVLLCGTAAGLTANALALRL